MRNLETQEETTGKTHQQNARYGRKNFRHTRQDKRNRILANKTYEIQGNSDKKNLENLGCYKISNLWIIEKGKRKIRSKAYSIFLTKL